MKNKMKWFFSFEVKFNELLMSLKTIFSIFIFVILPIQILLSFLIFKLNIFTLNFDRDLKIIWHFISNLYLFVFNENSTIDKIKDLTEVATFSLIKDFMFLFLLTSPIYVVIFLISYKRINKSSQEFNKKIYIRGAKLISENEILKNISNQKTKLTLGKVPMPIDVETQHILIIGSSGSGKTQFLKKPIKQCLNDNEARGIIHDIKGDWIAEHYNPLKDKIFNPVDKRSLKWNIFNDIETVYDIKNFCLWLIPDNPKANDSFWQNSARMILESILLYLFDNQKKSNKYLKQLLYLDAKDLYEKINGYGKGSQFLEKKDSFLTLQSQMSFIDFLEDGDFSFKKWIHTGKGFIFISNVEETEALMKPILTLAINVLASETLKLNDDRNRRIYFFLDEFTSLHKMEKILSLLKLGRSKGASIWLAFQDFQQLEKIYSKEDMRTVINNTATVLVLRLKEPESAEFFSKRFGKQEFKIKTETISTGVSANRDGFSLNEQIRDDYIVKDSEILNLPILNAYISIAGIEGVFKTSIEVEKTIIKNNSLELKELSKKEQINLLSDNIYLSKQETKESTNFSLNDDFIYIQKHNEKVDEFNKKTSIDDLFSDVINIH